LVPFPAWLPAGSKRVYFKGLSTIQKHLVSNMSKKGISIMLIPFFISTNIGSLKDDRMTTVVQLYSLRHKRSARWLLLFLSDPPIFVVKISPFGALTEITDKLPAWGEIIITILLT
jgi:hypothetical protein